jgi:mannitol-1-phosphate 5-dehydrogenase
MSKPTAVQFGAGGIGRGFVTQLFHESGLEVVFVDVAASVVDALNARGSYPIHIVGQNAETVPISDVRAVIGTDIQAVAAEVANAKVICTAVGAGALPYLAPALAAGLQQRTSPVNVILCENLHDAADVMRRAVAERLPDAERDAVLGRTGFVQAVVARMVPVPTDEERATDILAIRVEAYKRLPIDANAIVGELPPLVGIDPVANFEAWVERKLYIHNCAHAILGYAGSRFGYEYGWQALEDERIDALTDQIMAENGLALLKKHGFTADEMAAHIDDLKNRFRNRALGDTCRRLARDPIRKLAPDDRLVGAARLCQEMGVASKLSFVIALALNHSDPDDPVTVRLNGMIEKDGIEQTMQTVCGIAPEEPLGQDVLRHYKEIIA